MLSATKDRHAIYADFLGTPDGQLEDLLRRIAETLQLTSPQYQLAEDRYMAVAKCLAEAGSPLTLFLPDIYPQGSMALGTTCRPIRETEYDLDFVMELKRPPREITPVRLLDLLEGHLRANGNYASLVERKIRCIRLDYAGDFHMDILPALPDVPRGNGCIYVPDVPEGKLGGWKNSNPRGYVNWLNGQAALASMAETLEPRARVDPLPDQMPLHSIPPLKVAIQLIKRHRDMSFSNSNSDGPISIVLTTLAGQYYFGARTALQTVQETLVAWGSLIERTPGIPKVYNPSNTAELLSERWEKDPGLYAEFKKWVGDLQRQWEELQSAKAPQIYRLLAKMFGESPTHMVIEAQAEALRESRSVGRLAVTAGGILTTKTPAQRVVPVREHTFFGSKIFKKA
jgi:hypothetical protein